jgi:hypothetical protein
MRDPSTRDERADDPGVRRFAISKDGGIDDLAVCGIHGRLNRATTPGIRWAIYRTTDGKYVTKLAPSSDRPEEHMEGKIHERIDPRQAQLTWAGPWPARGDWLLLSLGIEERTLAASRLAELPALGGASSPESTRMLHWLAGQWPMPPACIHGPDDDGNLLWYADLDDIFHVRTWLAGVGRTDLYRKVRDGIADTRLTNRAYWLSRCALGASDVALAAAALTIAGGDGKENVLRYGAMDTSEEEKDRLFEFHRASLASRMFLKSVHEPATPSSPMASPQTTGATAPGQLATGSIRRSIVVVENKEAPLSARRV